MRVLHTESSVNWGGQEYRALEQMRWLNDHGHETVLAAKPGSAIMERAGAWGLEAVAVGFRGHYNPRAIVGARRLVRERAIDVADCHGSRDAVTLAFARRLCPVIRSRHVSQALKGKLHRRLQWRRGCDHIIATAGCIKEGIVDAGLSGPGRVTVVGEWAGDKFFDISGCTADRADLRREFVISEGIPVVSVVGMLRGDKAQEHLIDAAAILKRRGRTVVCLIVGGGISTQADYEEQLRARARAHGVQDAVIFTGYRDDVARITGASDALCVTSVAVEGQSRAVPQAFACETPVVASRIGGVPELVVPGETGWLVEPGDAAGYADALVEIFDNPERARAVATHARRFAEAHLTLDAKMAETLAVYDSTIRSFRSN